MNKVAYVSHYAAVVVCVYMLTVEGINCAYQGQHEVQDRKTVVPVSSSKTFLGPKAFSNNPSPQNTSIHDNDTVTVKSHKNAKENSWLLKVLLPYRTSILHSKIKSKYQSEPTQLGSQSIKSQSQSALPGKVGGLSNVQHFQKGEGYFVANSGFVKRTGWSKMSISRKKRRKRSVEGSSVGSVEELQPGERILSARSPSFHVITPESAANTSGDKNNSFVTKGAQSDVTVQKDGLFEIPVEWTEKGNHSAVVALIERYSIQRMIAHEAQVAFLCTVFLLCLLSWAVWYSGMCYRKKTIYMDWNFQDSHAFTSLKDILKRRWKYLPEQSFYEEVVVHDRGTDP